MNANDVVPRFFKSGVYEPHQTIVTLANAMDVGDQVTSQGCMSCTTILFRYKDRDDITGHDAEIKRLLVSFGKYSYLMILIQLAAYTAAIGQVDKSKFTVCFYCPSV